MPASARFFGCADADGVLSRASSARERDQRVVVRTGGRDATITQDALCRGRQSRALEWVVLLRAAREVGQVTIFDLTIEL